MVKLRGGCLGCGAGFRFLFVFIFLMAVVLVSWFLLIAEFIWYPYSIPAVLGQVSFFTAGATGQFVFVWAIATEVP